MQLIACPVCHAQYDVSTVDAPEITCRCGETLANRPLRAVDAVIARCGSCGAHVRAEAEACSYCGSDIVRDPEKLSCICPECFARNADESRFCTACGVGFRPEPLVVEGAELPCPACDGRMPPTQVGGIPLNECNLCHGLWVPGDHFDALVRRAAEARRERDPLAPAPRVTGANPARQNLAYRRCPQCGEFMHRINYRRSSGVILDECRSHGTWLDADELEQVAGFILSGGRTSSVLEDEHESARRAAAAAFARARIESQRAGPGRDWTRTNDRHGGGGLLRLLYDILS